jgi:hypothetical protein
MGVDDTVNTLEHVLPERSAPTGKHAVGTSPQTRDPGLVHPAHRDNGRSESDSDATLR